MVACCDETGLRSEFSLDVAKAVPGIVEKGIKLKCFPEIGSRIERHFERSLRDNVLNQGAKPA